MGAPNKLNSPITWPDQRAVKPTSSTNPTRISTQEIVYSSYAGTDITAVLVIPGEKGMFVLGELQTISYSMHRENTPVRTLGHVNPIGFVRGPRTIAGSLIFTQFNQYAFYKLAQFNQLINDNIYPVADMLPPFDVVLSFVNESGSFAKMKILGVNIIDEGTTMSVDDLVTEQTYTFLARGIQPLVSYVPDGLGNTEQRSASGEIIRFGA